MTNDGGGAAVWGPARADGAAVSGSGRLVAFGGCACKEGWSFRAATPVGTVVHAPR